MRTLVVGVGALGGLIAARLRAREHRARESSVWLATRNAESATRLRASGLRVTGVGGALPPTTAEVAAVDDYAADNPFDLIILATKAHDALQVAPRLARLLAPDGILLPLQNGAASQMVADRLSVDCVLGGLSNIGATTPALGVYEQRNAGHLLVGKLAGGESERAERVRRWLGRAVDVAVTSSFAGAVWSKLLLNCSVTTMGAIAAQTMREYVASPDGRELFNRTYDEALSVALASGAQLERMMVDPVPPASTAGSVRGPARDAWLGGILQHYGDVKASMLLDIERGRTTEIDFVNGYVVTLGRRFGVRTPTNAAIVDTVHEITRGQLTPHPRLLGRILAAGR